MAKRASDKKLRNAAITLAIVFVAALGLYRFLHTDPGRSFLLDAGAASVYESVQASLEKRIVRVLRRYGALSKQIKIASEAVDGRDVQVIRAETPPDASLVQINWAISRAARAAGCRVRSCREGEDGTIITMEIGTRRVLTQRVIVKKGSERQHFARAEAKRTPVVALCVDDFGFFNNTLVKDFLELDFPFTISVIPGLRHSEKIALAAAEAGKEVFCHLPMEAEKEGWDAGEIPLIRVAMKRAEIEKAMTRALETVPGAIGINNHMGSRATADRAVMETVLRVCRSRGLIFLDSYTTPNTIVREVAKEVGVAEAGNDLFLDNGVGETRENMSKLLSLAASRGTAVGIVHVKKENLEDLRWMADEARREGIDFVTIRQIIERRSMTVAEGGTR